MMNEDHKIVITGGHASPAVALIEEMQGEHPNWKIFYISIKYAFEGKSNLSFDYKVVSKVRNIHFVPIIAGRIQRRIGIWTIISLIKIPLGFLQAVYHIYLIKPDLIVSFGGFISTPIVVAGWVLGVPSISHEQTQTIGLANRINSIFSKRFAVSFKTTLKEIPSFKGVFTGNLLQNNLSNRSNPGKLLQVKNTVDKNGLPILFVTGGKSGSNFINKLIIKALPSLLIKYNIVHQTGSLDFKELQEFKSNRKNINYWPLEFVSGREWGWLINNASVVISRAGANIVLELLSARKPAILIPIPWTSRNEQEKNASYYCNSGLGIKLSQKQATANSLIKKLKLLKKRKFCLAREKQIFLPNGNIALLQEIERLLV